MQTELVIAIFTYIKQLVGHGTELVIATVRFIKYFYIYLQGCGTRDLLEKTLWTLLGILCSSLCCGTRHILMQTVLVIAIFFLICMLVNVLGVLCYSEDSIFGEFGSPAYTT